MGAGTGRAGVKLALDDHYSPVIAVSLRERGLDVIHVQDRGWQAEADEPLLGLCAATSRSSHVNGRAKAGPTRD